jgi:hypothetical protein
VLKQMPPGATPPLILNYSAATVPILQIALAGEGHVASRTSATSPSTYGARAAGDRCPVPRFPYPLRGQVQRQIQIDLDPAAMQARGLSGQRRGQCARRAEPDHAGRDAEDRQLRVYAIQLNNAPGRFEDLGNLPIKAVNGAMVYLRDVAQVRDGNPPQTNIVHVEGNRSALLQVLKNGSDLDAGDHRRASRRRWSGTSRRRCPSSSPSRCSATSRCS